VVPTTFCLAAAAFHQYFMSGQDIHHFAHRQAQYQELSLPKVNRPWNTSPRSENAMVLPLPGVQRSWNFHFQPETPNQHMISTWWWRSCSRPKCIASSLLYISRHICSSPDHMTSFLAQWHAEVYMPTYMLDFALADAVCNHGQQWQSQQELTDAGMWHGLVIVGRCPH